MRVLLAGLWVRRGLNAASALVILVAVTACVLGPMYGRASAEHLLDTQIAARQPFTTGLSFSLPAMKESVIPKGSPSAFQPPSTSDMLARVAQPFARPGVSSYFLPARRWLQDSGPTLDFKGHVFSVPLYWRQGMCGLARVHGRCPSAPGEALVQATMARTLGVRAGDKVTLTYQDRFLKPLRSKESGQTLVEATRTRLAAFTVVGTYRVKDPGSTAWFDLSRFVGIDNLRPPPPSAITASATPAAPALLVAPSSMTSEFFRAGIDRGIDPAAVDLDTMQATQTVAARFTSRTIARADTSTADNLDLVSLFDDVRSEHTLLSRVMLAALAPLVVLALLLLYALVAASAQVRRPYVALAKLRGHSRLQVFRFAVSEPFLVVAVATPIGVATAVTAAHLIARTWFLPGIPVAVDRVTVVALVLVVAASLVSSGAAAFAVIREPLLEALSSNARQRPASRASVVLRSSVVAVAVASVAQLLTSRHQASQLLALLAPMFIALAVAVGGAALLRAASRAWLRRTANSGGAPGFLASRRLARRGDLANLMVPLLLAVSVITFAVSSSAVADDWQRSRASAENGADHTYLANVSAGRLLQVTHNVDPKGRYVAAAAVDTSGDQTNRRVFVDTSRLARVAVWDDSWSSLSLPALQRRLHPAGLDHRLGFTGHRVGVHVSGVHLRSRSHDKVVLWLQYVDDTGEQTDVPLGRLHNGRSATLSSRVEQCTSRCLVEQLYLSGDSSSVLDTNGSVTLTRVEVDGAPVDWGLTRSGAWRAARPFAVSLIDPPVVPQATAGGLRLRLYLGHLPAGPSGVPPTMLSGYARITPSTTPDVAPVLVTEATKTGTASGAGSGLAIHYPQGVIVGTALGGESAPMRVVERVRALPIVGDQGELGDLETSLVEFEPPAGAVTTVELWAAPHTPASVLDAVRSAGVGLSPIGSYGATLHELRGNAFSLGLRLFLLVGLATLLLAIFGVFASAVLQSRWRSYEVASLRVVGVSQRALLLASVLEYVAMLALAVLLGVLSAWLALKLVLPSISFGPALAHDPAPTYALHWGPIGLVAGGLLALAVLIAVLVSRRTTRMGRPSTLRWAEQG